MASRLKALGLALIAVLALSAVAASGAWAAPLFTAEEYPAVGEATLEQEIGSGEVYFEAAGRKLECETTHFEAELVNDSSTIEATPDFTDHTEGGNCKAGGLINTTITENGCTQIFHAEEKVSEDHYTLGVTLSCEPEQAVEVHVGSSCKSTIFGQKVTGTLTGVNDTETEEVTLSGTFAIHGILHSNSALLCGKAVGEHEVTTNFVINNPTGISAETGGMSISGE